MKKIVELLETLRDLYALKAVLIASALTVGGWVSDDRLIVNKNVLYAVAVLVLATWLFVIA